MATDPAEVSPALRAVRPIEPDEAALLRHHQRWLHRITSLVGLAFILAHGAALLLVAALMPGPWRTTVLAILLTAMGLEGLVFGGVAVHVLLRVRRDVGEGRVTEIHGQLATVQPKGRGIVVAIGDVGLQLTPLQAEGLRSGDRATVAIATNCRAVLSVNGRPAPR